VTRTRSATDAAARFLAERDAVSLPARTARRDLQRATLDMLEAYEAAENGPREQRAGADRLHPDVVAAEQHAYETITALWGIEAAPRR
jgi:hypothetical protein